MAQSVTNLIAGLSKREKRLLGIVGLVFVSLIIFLFVFFVQMGISDLEKDGENYQKALSLIEKEEDNFLDAKLRGQQDKLKGKVKPTPLRTLVDKIAKQIDVAAPDVKELPELHHGTNWLERSVELSLRQIGLEKLTKFMEEVKGNEKKFPIAITKLEIRNLKRTQNAYNVKMVVSTYEQVAGAETANKGKSGGSRKGGQ